jgi:phage/plasmid-like protein (TIGR03299 family)
MTMAVVDVREIEKHSRVDSQIVMAGDIGSVYGGKIIDSKMSIRDAIVEAGLDWEVRISESAYAGDKRTKIPGYRSTFGVNPDGSRFGLGIVKSRYVPMQNWDAFKPFQSFIGDKACVESAGVLHGGRYTWICIDLGNFDILPEDQIKKHLLIINSHDGSSNILAQLMPNRLACQNMLNFSFGSGGGSEPFKIRHTGSALVRLDEVKNVMSIANEGFDKVQDAFHIMRDTRVSSEDHNIIIRNALGVTEEDRQKFLEGDYDKQPQWVNRIKEIDRVFEIGPGMDMPGLRGTVYGTFNALTGYYDHFRHVRGSGSNPDNTVESKLLGHAAEMKTKAFKACMDFCKN